MDKQDEADLKLERLLNDALHLLPMRHAPATLEARVLGELARRAVLPWWRHSFVHWPRVALFAFVAVCGGLVGIAFLGGSSVGAGLGSARTLRQVWTLMAAAAQALTSLLHAIPSGWLYQGLALAAALYALLFALGAAAYRTLYLDA